MPHTSASQGQTNTQKRTLTEGWDRVQVLAHCLCGNCGVCFCGRRDGQQTTAYGIKRDLNHSDYHPPFFFKKKGNPNTSATVRHHRPLLSDPSPRVLWEGLEGGIQHREIMFSLAAFDNCPPGGMGRGGVGGPTPPLGATWGEGEAERKTLNPMGCFFGLFNPPIQ